MRILFILFRPLFSQFLVRSELKHESREMNHIYIKSKVKFFQQIIYTNSLLVFQKLKILKWVLLFLRGIVSKNLPNWNLGGRQIVSGPIFSDSSCKNRLVAYLSAHEDQFWPKFSIFSTRGVKIGQNWRKINLYRKSPNFIRFA